MASREHELKRQQQVNQTLKQEEKFKEDDHHQQRARERRDAQRAARRQEEQRRSEMRQEQRRLDRLWEQRGAARLGGCFCRGQPNASVDHSSQPVGGLADEVNLQMWRLMQMFAEGYGRITSEQKRNRIHAKDVVDSEPGASPSATITNVEVQQWYLNRKHLLSIWTHVVKFGKRIEGPESEMRLRREQLW